MKAGVTWLSRARKRPSKSVKYVEVFSSSSFNLAPPFSERAHVKHELSKFGIVHKPFACCVDDTTHFLEIPLCNLVCDEQGFVVSEEFRYAVASHRDEGQHDKVLYRVWNADALEYDG